MPTANVMDRHDECASFSDAELINLIAEDTAYLKCVSHRTREYCIRFMQKLSHGADVDFLTDIYHDALIVLYEKARGGGFELTCSIQTYLNSICRNQLLSRLKSEARILSFDVQADADEDAGYLPGINDWLPGEDAGINVERMQAIMKGLEQMKGKGDCYELLMMIHYRNQTMKQVAGHFGYKNEQIAKNKNYLCREKLRALAQQVLRRPGK